MTKLDELLELLESDPNLKYYRKLEKEFNSNSKIKSKIESLYNLQKKMVLAQETQKPKLKAQLSDKYDILLKEIEQIPHLLEYLELQSDYNQLLQQIKFQIEKTVNSII